MSDRRNLSTIALNRENYEALQNLGKTGETFSTVLSRALKQVKITELPHNE